MDRLALGVGTVWIFFTIGAAALLGTDFILHEIRTLIRHDREPETDEATTTS
jgi:hypothetical protein